MLQIKRWLVTLFMLLIIIAGLGFVKFTQIKAAIAFGESFPEASETVEAVNAQWSTWQPKITVIGEVKATQNLDVRNEIEGILTKLNFESGAVVNKGDILAQLNIDTEKAQLDAIEAEIDLAKLEVKRFADLLNANASSKELLDRAKAQLAINQARARALEATIAKKTLIAPFTGTTSIHDWQVGTYLPANTIIVTLTGEHETVWVDFNLPQIYADIELGAKVNIAAPSVMARPIEATLVALNQQLNTNSRTLLARAKVVSPPKAMRPGVVVSVTFATGNAIPAVPIPNQAVRYDSFGTYVYVLVKDEKDDLRAMRRPVTVASKEVDLSFISKGLEAGETVATVGSAKLNNNLLTLIAPPSSDNKSSL